MLFKSVSLMVASVLSTSLLLASCGSDGDSKKSPSKEEKIGTTAVIPGSESGLTFADGTVKGTGSITTKNPLGELKSGSNIALTFTLEDGGELTLAAYGDNSNKGAVNLSFSRTGKVLSAKLEAAGKTADVSKNFTALDASADVSLLVDIHNDESPAHILVWKGDLANPDESNALFNSEKEGDGESPGSGTGTFWGLVLSKAAVKAATAGEPRFEHD